MLKKLSIFAFLFATLIGFSSCSSDDDDDNGGSSISGSGALTVNGKTWKPTSAPVIEDDQIVYLGDGHVFYAYIDMYMDELEVGDEVTPDGVTFPTENADYSYVSGEVTVVKISKDGDITLKFDNYTVKYDGKWNSQMTDMRNDDIMGVNTLKMNGTVRFFNPKD